MTNKEADDGQIIGQNTKVIFPDQWHSRPVTPSTEVHTVQNSDEEIAQFTAKNTSQLPALPPVATPLVPEASDFLEGDAPASDKVQAFLTRALGAGDGSNKVSSALVPWICDALLSNHSVKAYGRDLMHFLRQMQAQGVAPLQVTADKVKLYKRALLETGMTSATVARRLSVLRGAYEQLAAKGLVSWETAQDIAAVKAPGVLKNATPSLTQKQAVALLEAIPTDTL